MWLGTASLQLDLTMTKYLQKSFTVHAPVGADYRARFDAIFGSKEEPTPAREDDRTFTGLFDAMLGEDTGFVGDALDFCSKHGLSRDAEDDLFDVVRNGIDEESLQNQVLEFHKVYGQAIGESPMVPDPETVQLRLRLVAEEFFEFLAAHGVPTNYAHETVLERIENAALDGFMVDLVEAADAMADLDYVIEGTRIAYGIDGVPVAKEVHRSNMQKRWPDGTVHRNEHGKVIKPEGWTPPDIAGCLREQGME